MYAIYRGGNGSARGQVPAGENFGFPYPQELPAQHQCAHTADCGGESEQSDGDGCHAGRFGAIAQAAPQAAVLVDEAYFEFHGETLIKRMAARSRIFSSREHFPKPMAWPDCASAFSRGMRSRSTMVRRVSFALQRERGGACLSCRRRCEIRSTSRLCGRGAARPRTIARRNLRDWECITGRARPILCWCASGPQLTQLSSTDARARHSGARPLERSRVRRLCAYHLGLAQRSHRRDLLAALREMLQRTGVTLRGAPRHEKSQDRTQHARKPKFRLPSRSRAADDTGFPPASVSSITCWNCSRITADSISSWTRAGDLDVDQHHTVEDVGIVLGRRSTGARQQARHSARRIFSDADG